MLSVDDISLYYGSSRALRGVSVAAKAGEVTCVLGRNGVGKSSLLRAITGQRPISAGQITLEGKPISTLKPYDRAKLGVAYVPQVARFFRF